MGGSKNEESAYRSTVKLLRRQLQHFSVINESIQNREEIMKLVSERVVIDDEEDCIEITQKKCSELFLENLGLKTEIRILKENTPIKTRLDTGSEGEASQRLIEQTHDLQEKINQLQIELKLAKMNAKMEKKGQISDNKYSAFEESRRQLRMSLWISQSEISILENEIKEQKNHILEIINKIV
eukprot:GHVL01012757.1.p1 GENE.GHVL01012757.1~~GHVL01012757.1.p1  ORF type:complete len:183 (-),score=50.78 GHVL01012757.1:285-833(-)